MNATIAVRLRATKISSMLRVECFKAGDVLVKFCLSRELLHLSLLQCVMAVFFSSTQASCVRLIHLVQLKAFVPVYFSPVFHPIPKKIESPSLDLILKCFLTFAFVLISN